MTYNYLHISTKHTKKKKQLKLQSLKQKNYFKLFNQHVHVVLQIHAICF